MSKAQFFAELRERLRGLPPDERQRILLLYDQLFRDAEASGRSEEEIIESLGYHAMEPYPAPYGAPMYPSPSRTDSSLRMLAAALALGLFNLIFVLGPFIAVTSMLACAVAAGTVLLLSPIWGLVYVVLTGDFTNLMLQVFFVLFTTGMGLLILIACSFLVRWYWKALKAYVRLNLRLMKGE